jgi:hypothetical protein
MGFKSPSGAERRAQARQRTLLRGRICYGANYVMSVDCNIRNLNAEGAMLQVPAGQMLPTEFMLLQVVEGAAFEAHTIWRNGAGVGVAFGPRHDLKGVVEESLKPLRAIWAALPKA